jgi:FtsH-binding integral membrane protein
LLREALESARDLINELIVVNVTSTNNNDVITEVVGALTLYLDFINLFLNLLQLFGGRKE